jgi:hypothetical protein
VSGACDFVVDEEDNLQGRSYAGMKKDKKKTVRQRIQERKVKIREAEVKAKEELKQEDRGKLLYFAEEGGYSNKAADSLLESFRKPKVNTVIVEYPDEGGNPINHPFSISYGDTGFFNQTIMGELLKSVVN